MKRAALIAETLVALLVPLVWFGSCTSVPLPPAARDTCAASFRMNLSVGVQPHRVASFSHELERALRESGCFARVDLTKRFAAPPDLVAKVEHGWQAKAAMPFFTVLSLGLVPTIVDETYGLDFSLHAPAAPAASVAIDTRWSGKVWFGLAAAVLNASPGRTGENWRVHPRWVARVRHELDLRRAELEALARAGRTPI